MSEKQPGSANEPLPNNSKENSNEKTRDTFQIKIEGKNFEVVKTHFTYPEAIIEENGGVEGYDRFELSTKDFNETTKDSNLNEIAEKLGIGTEQ